MIIFFVFVAGVGGAYPTISGETSSIRLRAKTNALGFVMSYFSSWLFSFILPYLFNPDEANLGGKLGWIFFGLCIIGFVVLFFELPEMKERTYQEIDYMFETKVPTRAFKKYKFEDADVGDDFKN